MNTAPPVRTHATAAGFIGVRIRATPSARTLLTTALAVAAALRLIVIAFAGDVSSSANLWEYGEQGLCAWRTGLDLCLYYPGGVESYPSAYMPPLLSYLWLGLFEVFGDGSMARALFLAANFAAALGCVALVFHIAGKVWPSQWAPFSAAMLFAIYPTFVFVNATYHQTNWAVLLLLAVIAVAIKLAEGGQPWLFGGLGGLLCGLAALNRTEMLLIGPVLIGMGALWPRNLRTLMTCGVSAVLVMAVVMAPWTVRNYQEFGRVIPTAQSSGYNLWKAFTPFTNGSGNLTEQPGGPGDRERELIRASVEPGLDYETRLQDAYADVFDHDLQDASTERLVQLTATKALLLWGLDWTDRDVTDRAAYLVPWAVVNLLAMFGLIAAWRGRRRAGALPAAVCTAAVGLLTIAYVITAVHARYRMHIEPFLFVAAGIGAQTLWTRFISRRSEIDV